MAAKKPYRITPSLGPDLHQAATQFYWDTIGDPTGTGQPSYQPGSKVTGNDGHVYVFVRAAANIAANGSFGINETTWATTTGTTYTAPVAVTSGQWFHARAAAL